jgi:uncharacterized cupredoxin-like copper-binding protein
LAACEPGATDNTNILPTGVPPQVATGIAQAPTAAAQAAGTSAAIGNAAQTAAVPAATSAAGALSTAAPFAQTAVSGAQTSVAPAQAAIATALLPVQTAIAPAETAVASVTPPASASAIQVQLSDNKIDVPATLKAGILLFVIKNNGSAEHNFEIQGANIDKKLDANLKPGDTGTLPIQLAPGNYRMFDPTGDYRNQGLLVNLTVTP